MTAYKDVELINRFVEKMPKNNWRVYIHLDKKSQIDIEQIDKRAKVYKLYNIKWGSINHLYSIVELLRIARKTAKKDSYFHILTGQDFWLTPPEMFDKFIVDGDLYVNIVSNPNWYHGGKDIWKYNTLVNLLDLRKPVWRKLNRGYMFLQDLFGVSKPLPDYPIYGGSVYCSITFDAVEYILTSSIANEMLRTLKNSAIGEEIFFQTVLMNSPYRTKINPNNLRYSDWSVKNAPKNLSLEDFDKIKSSKCLFCRKLSSNSTLLDKLPLKETR